MDVYSGTIIQEDLQFSKVLYILSKGRHRCLSYR
jgi:hypothetical protein